MLEPRQPAANMGNAFMHPALGSATRLAAFCVTGRSLLAVFLYHDQCIHSSTRERQALLSTITACWSVLEISGKFAACSLVLRYFICETNLLLATA